MARWTRRVRRGAAVGAGVLLVGSLAAWIAGAYRFDDLSYRFGRWRQVMPPSGSILEWSFEADSIGACNGRGAVALRFERYTSYAPDLENLQSWSSWHGWQHAHGPAAWMRRDDTPHTFWMRWDNFSVLGLRVSPIAKQGSEIRLVSIPHWMLAGALGVATVLLVRPDVVRWRRRRRGRCVACGYDRKGLDTKERCPECGT